MGNYIFGIDLGGTTVKLGFFDVKGELLDKWEIPTRKDNGGELILTDIREAVFKKLEEENVSMSQIAGVGLGIPGPVLETGVVGKCANLGWGVFNVEEEMSSLLGGVKVKVGNDANVAALGEMWKGGGKGHKNVVMVTLGTGVGGGVIVDGRIVPGSSGAGGEIGHMMMSKTETAVCGCGKTGCLEQYASATGIVKLAQKKLVESEKPSGLRSIHYISAKEIFDQAKQGDELALELVEEVYEMLGTALSHIACVVDPEIIVIGGGVSKAGEMITEGVQKYFKKYVFHTCRDAEFALAKLGNDAGMYGAAKMVLG